VSETPPPDIASKDSVVITPYRDGPLLVRGPVRFTAADGSPIPNQRDPVALCRCGRSQIKPFCDGTHKLIGFRADDGTERLGFNGTERLGLPHRAGVESS
jgi:CDGSH-type Zn-finger protein